MRKNSIREGDLSLVTMLVRPASIIGWIVWAACAVAILFALSALGEASSKLELAVSVALIFCLIGALYALRSRQP